MYKTLTSVTSQKGVDGVRAGTWVCACNSMSRNVRVGMKRGLDEYLHIQKPRKKLWKNSISTQKMGGGSQKLRVEKIKTKVKGRGHLSCS